MGVSLGIVAQCLMSSSIDRNLLPCKVCLFVVFSPEKRDLPEMMSLVWMQLMFLGFVC